MDKPLRPLDVETKLDSIDDNYSCGTTTIFAKVNKWYPSSDKTFELVISIFIYYVFLLVKQKSIILLDNSKVKMIWWSVVLPENFSGNFTTDQKGFSKWLEK